MSTIQTVLIVSADPGRRAAWADRMAARGHRVLRCAGPVATACALLQGAPECPLQAEATVALYDEAALGPVIRPILAARHHPPIAVGRDRPSADGGREPKIVGSMAADAHILGCFGPEGGALLR